MASLITLKWPLYSIPMVCFECLHVVTLYNFVAVENLRQIDMVIV